MTHRLPAPPWLCSTDEPHISGNTLESRHGMHCFADGASARRSAMPSSHSPDQNHLLAALPAAEFERLAPRLELVPMPLGEMLYQPGRQIRHAYFPTTAVVSLQYATESGASVETAAVGSEGVVGIELFMGGDTIPSSAVVRAAGHAYRLPGGSFKQEFDRAGLMQQLLLRYTRTMITQMIQTAACNRHHSTDRQMCRFLLSALDRAPSNELILTQESIACLLGVRREGITAAAGRLQRAGIISCRRGHITVLERSRLESRACECYAAVRKELSRLLSDVRQCGQPASWQHGVVAGWGPGMMYNARVASLAAFPQA